MNQQVYQAKIMNEKIKWSPESWKKKPAKHQPVYKDIDTLKLILNEKTKK